MLTIELTEAQVKALIHACTFSIDEREADEIMLMAHDILVTALTGHAKMRQRLNVLGGLVVELSTPLTPLPPKE